MAAARVGTTIAYCTYVYERYGRFPDSGGPFCNLMSHQAHHVDPDFCGAFYRPGALTPSHDAHAAVWH